MRFVTVAGRAGALAVSLLAAWWFFHGLGRSVQAVEGEFRESGAMLRQLGVGLGEE